MDTNSLMSSVSTVGFPIFCAIALGYFVLYLTKVAQQDKEKLYDELAKNRVINQGFLEAIQTISNEVKAVNDKVDKVKSDVDDIKTNINQ